MSMTQGTQRRGNWVRDSEHVVFRVVSLAFSIGSAYALVEFFEILCNYAKAVSAVETGAVSWVTHAPHAQQAAMAFLTYMGWSILPLVSPMMAAVDVDVMRRRIGE